MSNMPPPRRFSALADPVSNDALPQASWTVAPLKAGNPALLTDRITQPAFS